MRSNTMRCARRRRASLPLPRLRYGRPGPDQCHPGIRQPFCRRRGAGRAGRRTDRQCACQRQSDGVRHDRSAFGKQQRHARLHREGIQGHARSVKSNLDLLPRNAGTDAVEDAALKLLALGEGKTGFFKLRQKELDANDYGQIIQEETRKRNVGFDIGPQQLVDGVQSETNASTWQARAARFRLRPWSCWRSALSRSRRPARSRACDGRDHPQPPARHRRHLRGIQQHRRRLHRFG